MGDVNLAGSPLCLLLANLTHDMKILEKSKIVDINQIKNWEQNPRAIKKEDFERLKNQIREHGQYKPLLCDSPEEKEGYYPIGGNMRLRAFRELGYTNIWITVAKPDNDADRIKVALSDNDNAGYYDEQALAEQLYPHKDQIWTDYKANLETPHECPECGHKWSELKECQKA